MAIPPILILGGAGALLLYLFSGDKKAETPEAEEDDTKSKDLDLDVVVKQPAGVVNGTCPGYTEMGMAEAQGILKKMNYKGADGKALAADGKWDANTKFAMMDYQKVKGLTVDGYLGKQTGDALKNSLTADIVGPPPAADAGAVSEQFGYKDGFESKGQGYNFDALCANIGSGCNATRYDKGFCSGAGDVGYKEGLAAKGYEPSAVAAAYDSNSNACWRAGFKKGGGEALATKPPAKPSADQQAFMDATSGTLADAIAAGVKGEYASVAGIDPFWAKVGATVDMQRQGVVMARARRAGQGPIATARLTASQRQAAIDGCYERGRQAGYASVYAHSDPYMAGENTAHYTDGLAGPCREAYNDGFAMGQSQRRANTIAPGDPVPADVSWSQNSGWGAAPRQYGPFGRLS
mgnify:FL=1